MTDTEGGRKRGSAGDAGVVRRQRVTLGIMTKVRTLSGVMVMKTGGWGRGWRRVGNRRAFFSINQDVINSLLFVTNAS